MEDQTYFLKDWLTKPDFKNWLADTMIILLLVVRFVIKALNYLI